MHNLIDNTFLKTFLYWISIFYMTHDRICSSQSPSLLDAARKTSGFQNYEDFS